jgi:hypothetical protein
MVRKGDEWLKNRHFTEGSVLNMLAHPTKKALNGQSNGAFKAWLEEGGVIETP